MMLAKMRAAAHPVALKLPHWLTVTIASLAVTSVTAVEQYLTNVPTEQWLAGLTSPKTLLPIAVRAVALGVAAAVGQGLLLLKEWLAKPPPPDVPVVPPAPPAQFGFAPLLLVLAGLSGIPALTAPGCTPAQAADFNKAAQIVLADLTNGVALNLIEDAIRQYVPHGGDVDAFIDAIIAYLHDDGELPPNVEPAALTMQGKIAMKLSMKGK
jgi:hypothetical protein